MCKIDVWKRESERIKVDRSGGIQLYLKPHLTLTMRKRGPSFLKLAIATCRPSASRVSGKQWLHAIWVAD